MRTVYERWIRWVSRGLPPDRRARWREEWRSDLQALEASGAGPGRILGWAAGLAWTVLMIRRTGATTMTGWMRDVRTAVRGFLREPGFTALALVTLGLGIGVNTAMFSVVNGVVLRPLPYPEPDELVSVATEFPTMDFYDFWVSPPEYFEIREQARSFDEVGGYRAFPMTVGGGDRPERVQAAIATHTLFDVLGVPPALGRSWTDQESLPDAAPTAVLSWELFQRSFGGDRSLVGRDVEVNGASTRVLGVMPAGFDVESQGIELWIPASLDPANRQNRASHYLELVGRLEEGSTLAAARTELDRLVARWDEEAGDRHSLSTSGHPLVVEPFHQEVVGEVRTALLVLLGAVGFVLLIACANVANLLLVRGEGRAREVAIRSALGASRGRLLRLFLVEGLVLSVAGALAGLGLGWLCLDVLRLVQPPDLPRLQEVGLDGWVLLATTGVAAAVGVVFGLAPARRALDRDPAGTLGSESLRTTDSAARQGLRSTLVVAEVALALVLSVGAGLMLRSFDALSGVDPGVRTESVLTFETYLPETDYGTPEEIGAFVSSLTSELEALPGVVSAAATDELPTRQSLAANDIELEGVVRQPDGPPHNADFFSVVTQDYVETLEMPVLEGRDFQAADDASGRPVVLVNRAFAQAFFPGQSAVGRRVRACCGDEEPWYEIVGVLENVRQAGLHEDPGTEIYFHHLQAPQQQWGVVIRTRGEPDALAASARRVMAELDPGLPVARLQSMDGVVGEAMARDRFLTALMAGFAGLALLLAAVGTYGVMSYSVSRRSREMGIRVAMGAPASSVLRLVMLDGLRVAAIGLALGLLGAWGLTGVLDSILFGVDTRDPLSFLVGPTIMGAVALLACWVPARRATRVDPVEALRAD